MTTSRTRGCIVAALLAITAALPATAEAATVSTTTSCIDVNATSDQFVDVSASGLDSGVAYYATLELTPADGDVEVGYADVTRDSDATGTSRVWFDAGAYAFNAPQFGDGAGIWVKLRDANWVVAAEARIPLCGADVTGPAFAAVADRTVEATGPDGANVTYDAPAATDDVDGAVTATCTPASGSTFPMGETTVDCAATDAAGNTGTKSFVVTVADTTAPHLTLPADVTTDATSASGAPVSFTAIASDAVDGAVPVTCDPASGSTFAVGTTTVTCSATDAAGNPAQGTFTVTVRAQAQQAASPSLEDLLAQLRSDVLRGRSPQKACNTLNVIENQIRARTGKTITQRQADQYLAAARFASALLRCR